MYWIILVVLFGHWFISLFFHTAFLHRYASHQMFTMKKNTERTFYFFTWFFQGSSYLVPRAYAVLHRMHHDHSDTEKDPHSPHFFKNVFLMMWETKKTFASFNTGGAIPEKKYLKDLPIWDKLDRFGDFFLVRIGWGLVYALLYSFLIYHFNLSWFWMFLLPVHFLMGPIQGAFVNWCGHKYGYQNFDNNDRSKNSSPFGFLLMGELFQNNHHKHPLSPNFAKRWFEFDFTYPVLKVLSWLKIIEFTKAA